MAALGAGGAQAASFQAQSDWAEKLIANVAASSNVYASDPTVVSVPGYNGATAYANRSTCAPFVTRVMKNANAISDASYKSWFGSTSPTSAQYYGAIVNQVHFTQIKNMANIQRGDIIAVNYLPCAAKSTTGHTMLALSGATLRAVDTKPLIAGTRQYEILIADSSSSPHDGTDSTGKAYTDTRGSGDGAGIGTLRIYADAVTGELRGYSWSNDSGSVYYDDANCRQIAVGRMN